MWEHACHLQSFLVALRQPQPLPLQPCASSATPPHGTRGRRGPSQQCVLVLGPVRSAASPVWLWPLQCDPSRCERRTTRPRPRPRPRLAFPFTCSWVFACFQLGCDKQGSDTHSHTSLCRHVLSDLRVKWLYRIVGMSLAFFKNFQNNFFFLVFVTFSIPSSSV